MEPDFSGWATKANLKCSDGRTIMPDAFKHQDKVTVPLVWSHGLHDVENILGHAILTNVAGEGVRCDAFFNDTTKGQAAKKIVSHGDIKQLSILANKLVERSKQVFHGMIREVSLVPAGANPGALIDFVAVRHSDDPDDITVMDDEAVITTGLPLEFAHADSDDKDDSDDSSEETAQEVFDSLTEKQKNVVLHMLEVALEDGASAEHSDSDEDEADETDEDDQESNEGDLNHQEGNDTMSRNVFDQTDSSTGGSNEAGERRYLAHNEIQEIKENWKRGGSMKQAVEQFALAHGIENLDLLFPDPKMVGNVEWDKRRTEWVEGVLNGTRKSPFSRIKTMLADITQEQARARGYIKGNLKKEEWFGLTKRTTAPTTVYKKQKLDRDDILDATELDVVSWMKAEMQMMLKEEIARAILIGDGREVGDEDKIKDPVGAQDGVGIRSILHDDDLYSVTVNVNVDDANSNYNEIIDAVVRSRKLYKGSGQPTFYTTEDVITEFLLLRDTMGRKLYRNVDELASDLRVSSLVAVEVMEDEPDVIGIMVNLNDYNVGTDKGGEVTLFDDFDIDYNQYKYLIETRFSGALVKIRSALVIKKTAGTNVLVTPAALAFDQETNTITYAAQTGVVYKIDGVAMAADAVITEDTVVTAEPSSGYYFPNNAEDEWFYHYEA